MTVVQAMVNDCGLSHGNWPWLVYVIQAMVNECSLGCRWLLWL